MRSTFSGSSGPRSIHHLASARGLVPLERLAIYAGAAAAFAMVVCILLGILR
jgi:hypothetical protein